MGSKRGYTLPSRLALQTKDANLGIIGGDDAKIESFPYQSDWHVRVRAGSTLRTSGGQYPHAKKVLYDSRFTMKNLRYDVGLIKLETPLVLGPAVQPVQLVAVGAEPGVGSTITLSGWGVGDSGGPAVDENGRQVGIVSFGNGCANWLFPGVYTNLANAEVRKFIDNSMQSM
ncbi:hypothetical protein FOCC_FOCC012238 [Frankliniella occidentalis]|nr:hypothetical protein FOCC_FOCC012238 [Frankliniella occidentalis]